jgi:two-component system chemotaxis response regulator CheY
VKILVVDDSKAMRMIVIRNLRQAGFGDATVIEAENGLMALDKVTTDAPNLILCDWNMPEMTGIEFLRALRSSGNDTPFGFVTSESTPAMRDQALAAGAAFLLAKPFSTDDFQKFLAKVA